MFCSNCGFPVHANTHHCPLCECNIEAAPPFSVEGALASGTALHDDQYRVGHVTSQDRFTLTYLGCELALERLVVIREFFPERSQRQDGHVVPPLGMSVEAFETCWEQFVEESYEQSRFEAPEIADVHAFFETDNSAYVVTKHFARLNLREEIEQRRRFTETEAIYLARGIGAAVQVLHQKSVLHLDLKPENLVTYEDNRAVLLDLGLSKKLEATARFGKWNFEDCPPPGTPAYAAPEQSRIESGNALSEATDVYGLGAVLYELLTGIKPVEAQTREQGKDALRPLRELQPELSEATEQAVLAALQLPQSARPQSIVDFLKLLVTPAEAADNTIEDETDAAAESKGAVSEGGSVKVRSPINYVKLIETFCGLSLVIVGWVVIGYRLSHTKRQPALASFATQDTASSSSSATDQKSASGTTGSTPAQKPTPIPAIFDSTGTWQGNYGGIPATIVFPRRQGATSYGVLTSVTPEGVHQISLRMQEKVGTSQVTIEQMRFVVQPRASSWVLSNLSGTFGGASNTMSGKADDSGVKWSFSKLSPEAKEIRIAIDAEATSDLRGKWRGQFANASANFIIEKQQGDAFGGTLSTLPTALASAPKLSQNKRPVKQEEMTQKVDVLGYIVPATRAVIMAEAEVSTDQTSGTWALGQEVGTMTAEGAISGSRFDGKSGSYRWSFVKIGPLATPTPSDGG